MNDVGNVHEETGSAPIGLEVRVSAFAAASATPAVDQATFYRYRLVYRGSAPLDSAYVGFWMDSDLGDAIDDMVGSDTTLGLGYTYNGDEMDNVYGIPPAVGWTVVTGPVGLPNGRDDDGDGDVDEAGERLGMTAAGCPWKNGGDPFRDPGTATEYYACLQGLHINGEPVTAAGLGHMTDGPVTPYTFSGDPVTDGCWSMVNDCLGGSITTGDYRMMVAMGPFRMTPGSVQDVVVAVPFAQGTGHLDSITRLRAATATVQAYAAPVSVEAPPLPDALPALRAYPNPFAERVTLSYAGVRPGPVEVTVLDVLGRVVVRETLRSQAGAWTWAPDGVPPGLYIVRVEAGGAVRSALVVKTR